MPGTKLTFELQKARGATYRYEDVTLRSPRACRDLMQADGFRARRRGRKIGRARHQGEAQAVALPRTLEKIAAELANETTRNSLCDSVPS